MKRIVIYLFFSLLFFSFNAEAQIKVGSNGNVGIGNWFNNNDPGSNYVLETTGGNIYFNTPGGRGFWLEGKYGSTFSGGWSHGGFLGYGNNWFYRTYTNKLYYTYGSLGVSDRRIKKNIRPIKGSLSRLLQVRPVKYDFNQKILKNSNPKDLKRLLVEGENHVGVIAQDLLEIFPDLVEYDKESDLFAVNYTELIPYLIKAIQEQQEHITELEKRIK